MDVFTMVAVIVAISCGTAIVTEYLKTRRRERGKAPSAELLEEVEALKQRIAALEAIVTDERYHLERELDRLEQRG